MRQYLDSCGRGNDGLDGEKPPELEGYRVSKMKDGKG